MSYAITLLCILFALNLLFFLFGEPEANSPMLGVLKGFFYGGDVDWGKIIFSWSTVVKMAIIVPIIFAVVALSPPLVSGGYGAVHVPLIFGMSIFIVLFLIPNFGFIGFPYPVDMIVYVIFGFMAIISLVGFLRGE